MYIQKAAIIADWFRLHFGFIDTRAYNNNYKM